MKPLYGIPEVGNHWFADYYLHYKNKLVGNLTWNFVCIANYLNFLYG